MALVIEDGSGVVGANSFVDLDGLREFATTRGATLPSDDAELTKISFRVVDYLESLRDRYQGSKTATDQALQFPRTGVVIDGAQVASNAIPIELINAQCQLAIEVANGVDLTPAVTERALKRQRTGPLEKEWFDASSQPFLPSVERWLKPLLSNTAALRVTRI